MKKFVMKIRQQLFIYLYAFGKKFGLEKNTVSILCYHSLEKTNDLYAIDLDMFKLHVEKMRKNNSFISLDDIFKKIQGEKTEKPAVAITFDDGYKNFLTALPTFKKYGIPVALFVLAEPENANRKELDNNSPLLSFEEIKKLHKSGITIGCHSGTHADFMLLTEKDMEREIVHAKKILEEKLGFAITYFAYPKGVHTQNMQRIAQKAGYRAAFAVTPGVITEKTNRFAIPRVVIDCSYTADDFPAIYSKTVFTVKKILNSLGIGKIIYKVQKLL